METTTLERELLDLEHQYWQAIKQKDFATALRLTDDPCIVAGAQGIAAVDKKTFEQMMKSAPWTLEDFAIRDEVEVRQLSDDVAVLAYRVHERLTVNGKPVSMEAADASTWVRRGDRWLCALHTEAIAGDPYGRDRQTAH